MSRLSCVLAAAALLGGAAVSLSARQEPVFRSGTESVPVYATVVSTDGHLRTGLTAADFQVLDNGRPQPISIFDNGLQPISIVIMLDMSGSMSGNLTLLRRSAVQIFTRLLPADKARIGNFGYRIDIEPARFTNDVDVLTRALWLDLEPGGPTPLWGAINAAMTALAHLDGRRVVLVLTDGKNTGLRMGAADGPTLGEVASRAEAEDFMIYSIGMRSSSGFTPVSRGGIGGWGARARGLGGSDEPDPGIRQLADASGGGYFELGAGSDLGAVFAQVADELHRQYLLGFVMPEADGKVHQLDVRTTDPSLHVRARRTYVAQKRRDG